MIALITPTGAREQQIGICAKLMERQTFDGDVTWIIVDDAEPRTTDFIPCDFRDRWEIIKIHPSPPWSVGQNTQGRNLAAGMNALLKNYNRSSIDAVYIIEDDDYYKPEYIAEMRRRIDGFTIAGETHTIYYNVRERRWVENQNAEWSSLFQTVFTMGALSTFQKLYAEKFIDWAMFRLIDHGKNLFRAGNLAVGIKGQNGRAGIGAGHGYMRNMFSDPTGEKLIELIGDDSKYYLS